ncbi:MAG: M15 family metallopeptidase, partial [Clostridia bacterium]|nr:M15 family metallopeptidase [Clostridia bacterium]
AADGRTLSVISAYRSFEKQKSNFDRALNGYLSSGYSYEDAYRLTCRYYALPGASEHQTGLCCDITTQVGELTDSFANTGIYKWLSENAHRFGFILRYPKGGEGSTGISYEPWHYRYVGRKYAALIYESGLTLEEYLEKYPS